MNNGVNAGKLPISVALTSFNPADKKAAATAEPAKQTAQINHLSGASWKNIDDAADNPLNLAINRTCDFYLREQLPDGYWWAELESNCTITAEYLLFFRLLGIVDHDRERKIANYLLRQQTEEGYWCVWHGGPGDLSTTIESYFALKLAGYSADHPAMVKAREFILANGGILKARVFTKIFLAMFGEFSWLGVPSMPVELVLLPNWAYFNIYELASWARSSIVPLSIVMTYKPALKLPPESRIQELYVRPPRPSDYSFSKEEGIFTLKNIFIGLDHLLKVYESSPFRPLKNKGFKVAEEWIVEHQEVTGDWAGIQPAMVYSILALHYLGYENDHPVIVKGLDALVDFCIEDQDSLCLQSCISPIWDTALTLLAMQEADIPTDHPALVKASEWLLGRQARIRGDWKIKAPELEAGGWAFEFQNEWFSDVDDSAAVMIGIKNIRLQDDKAKQEAITRGINWCLGMQSSNGGWGAFDKDNTKHMLNKIPFADMEALIDPPTADLTGRMLELMGHFGYEKTHHIAVRALEFLKKDQTPEGAWFGRWGVNYIYGTWYVLMGLEAIGEDMQQPYIRKAVNWLKSCQNLDGGWGEVCDSYGDRSLMGSGDSTASQTAWALMGLMAAGELDCNAVERGIQYLLSTQKEDGTWDEDAFTGTGFPKYFKIKYYNYRICFPLTALGRFRRLRRNSAT